MSIALPLILDAGYAIDRDMTEKLKGHIGATLTIAHIYTLVKGAIIGPSSHLNHDGAAISCCLDAEYSRPRPWQWIPPSSLMERNGPSNNPDQHNATESGMGGRQTRLRGTNTRENLLEALLGKVSTITMIDRDDMEPDAPLAGYSLDSLISVELRNWILRETGVDLSLPSIVRAASLRALAADILAQRDAQQSV